MGDIHVHDDKCWREFYPCAMARIEYLENQLQRAGSLTEIADRLGRIESALSTVTLAGVSSQGDGDA